MTRDELIEYLLDKDKSIKRWQLEQMARCQLVDEWLRWNGIIGFTDKIIKVVFAAYQPITLQMVFDDMDADKKPEELLLLYESMTDAQRDEFLRLTGNINDDHRLHGLNGFLTTN